VTSDARLRRGANPAIDDERVYTSTIQEGSDLHCRSMAIHKQLFCKDNRTMANTDDSWDKFGKEDPYYGVISHERFRRSAMVGNARLEFFKSGEEHVQGLFETIRAHIDADFSPRSALDFGCGVGRIAIPLARRVAAVVAADVSEAMLSEAARNCAEQKVDNVKLIRSDDTLAAVPSNVEFIHSFIVFQHIPTIRGLVILQHMLRLLADEGVGALHFTFTRRAAKYRIVFQRIRGSVPLANGFYNLLCGRRFSYPYMEMNRYEINRILDMLYRNGCHDVHMRFSDHRGFIGAMLYFKKRPLRPL
jgi:2-polyprenyl-3-methyl-5-hydroxy-6-metoxy-1,4-benzoquinol methylase